MDNENLSVTYFKRKLKRKVNKAEHKRARLENIPSILHKSFVDLSEDSLDDQSRSGDNTIQETEMQEDCIAAASSNLNVLSKQDNKEYESADRSENVNDNGYDDNFNESNHSSDDVDVNDSDGALLTKFDVGDISMAEKSASTWLTNSSWRKQEDGSCEKRTERHVSESLRGKKRSST